MCSIYVTISVSRAGWRARRGDSVSCVCVTGWGWRWGGTHKVAIFIYHVAPPRRERRFCQVCVWWAPTRPLPTLHLLCACVCEWDRERERKRRRRRKGTSCTCAAKRKEVSRLAWPASVCFSCMCVCVCVGDGEGFYRAFFLNSLFLKKKMRSYISFRNRCSVPRKTAGKKQQKTDVMKQMDVPHFPLIWPVCWREDNDALRCLVNLMGKKKDTPTPPTKNL